MADNQQLPQSNVANPPQQQLGQGTDQQPGQQPQFQTDTIGRRQQGTGFTNINRILEAGKGSGQQLGQAIGQGIGQQAGQFQQGLTQAQQQFGQGVQQNTYNTDANSTAVKNAITNIMTPGQQQGDTANAQQFQQYISGNYTGPQQLSNTDQLGLKAANLQALGGATQNNYGRQGLLQQFVGKGQYTSGQQNLDNLLLGQPGSQNSLQQVRQQTNNVGQQLSQAETQAQQQAQQATLQNKLFGQQALGQLSGAEQNIYNNAAKSASDLNTQNLAQQQSAQGLSKTLQDALNSDKISSTSNQLDQSNELNKLIQSGLLNSDTLSKMGIDTNQYAGNINLPGLATMLASSSQNYNKLGVGDAISGSDAAKLQALQQLGGQAASSIAPSDITQNQLNSATAQGYTGPAVYNAYGNAKTTTGTIGNNVTQSTLADFNKQNTDLQNQSTQNQTQQSDIQTKMNQQLQEAIQAQKNAGINGTPVDENSIKQSLLNNPNTYYSQEAKQLSQLQSQTPDLQAQQQVLQLQQPQFQTIQDLLAKYGGQIQQGTAGTNVLTGQKIAPQVGAPGAFRNR